MVRKNLPVVLWLRGVHFHSRRVTRDPTLTVHVVQLRLYSDVHLHSPTWLAYLAHPLGSPTWLAYLAHPLGSPSGLAASNILQLAGISCLFEVVTLRSACSLLELVADQSSFIEASALKLDAYWNSCLLTLVGAHWSLLLLCVCCPLELRARQTNCLSGFRDVHFRLLTLRCDLLV